MGRTSLQGGTGGDHIGARWCRIGPPRERSNVVETCAPVQRRYVRNGRGRPEESGGNCGDGRHVEAGRELRSTLPCPVVSLGCGVRGATLDSKVCSLARAGGKEHGRDNP